MDEEENFIKSLSHFPHLSNTHQSKFKLNFIIKNLISYKNIHKTEILRIAIKLFLFKFLNTS